MENFHEKFPKGNRRIQLKHPKNKYKVGDQVRIKSIEEIKKIPGSRLERDGGIQLPDGYWNPGMEKYCGMRARIKSCYSLHDSRYDLDVTANHYFTESMIKPLSNLIILKDLQLFNEDLL